MPSRCPGAVSTDTCTLSVSATNGTSVVANGTDSTSSRMIALEPLTMTRVLPGQTLSPLVANATQDAPARVG